MSEGVRSQPLRIVSMGGGTGLATLLRGLKRYIQAADGALEITAVVTVTDDGGSSGRLRRDFDVLPPGDIRNCMVALCRDEALLSQLFNYRFTGGRGLKGHSFGNLFLMAMTHLTGDFAQAVKLSSEVLAVRGRIYPSTAANVRLKATLVGGQKVSGETRISRSLRPIQRVELSPRRARPLKETLDAIAQADLITLGPGSLYTSVIPHLLVEGIPQAIAASPAVKVYFANLMTQPGETTGMDGASDHLAALLRHGLRHGARHAGRRASRLIDVCVVNTGPILRKALEQYRAREARPVQNDVRKIEATGVTVVEADLVRIAGRRLQEKIRHDPGAISAIAIELARQGRRAKERLAS
ncbi:MAG: YvcK family protein [Acidobacteriia bacterium]|nr:YvcK family protein [Terriglobia bacterium]